MPLYEFECSRCHRRFEELVTLAESRQGNPPCPHCGETGVEKVVSGFATGSATGPTGGAPACGGGGGFT